MLFSGGFVKRERSFLISNIYSYGLARLRVLSEGKFF
jgi:hypothetical protein